MTRTRRLSLLAAALVAILVSTAVALSNSGGTDAPAKATGAAARLEAAAKACGTSSDQRACIAQVLRATIETGDREVVLSTTYAFDDALLDGPCSEVALEVAKQYWIESKDRTPANLQRSLAAFNVEGCHTGLVFGLFAAVTETDKDLAGERWRGLIEWCGVNMSVDWESHRTDCQTPLGHSMYDLSNGDVDVAMKLCDTIDKKYSGVRAGCAYGIYARKVQTHPELYGMSARQMAGFCSADLATDLQQGCSSAAGAFISQRSATLEELLGTGDDSLHAQYAACQGIGVDAGPCVQRLYSTPAFNFRHDGVKTAQLCAGADDQALCIESANRWLDELPGRTD